MSYDTQMEIAREAHESRLCFTCDRCGKAIDKADEVLSEDFCGHCRDLAEAAAAEDDRAEEEAHREDAGEIGSSAEGSGMSRDTLPAIASAGGTGVSGQTPFDSGQHQPELSANEPDDSMSLETPRGAMVRFLGEGGWPGRDVPHALLAGLIPESLYTVRRIAVGAWQSEVMLTEFPHQSFNTVMFTNVDPAQFATDTAKTLGVES